MFWSHNLIGGIIVNIVPSIIITFIIIRFVNLDRFENSRSGKYISKYMSSVTEIIRFSGNIIMMIGAWYHSVLLICIALAIIILAGYPHDNACTESFFATLKKEWVYHRKYRDLEHLDDSLFEYIELFYNRKRLHSSLENLTPREYYHKYTVAKTA